MHRLTARVALSTAVVGAATLMSTGPAPASSPPDTRQLQYAAVAAEYGVPESVLLAVSYLESRWDTNAGTPSTSGGYGPMHLTDAEYVASLPGNHHDHDGEDPRGDDSRPVRTVDSGGVPAPAPEALRSLDRAAELTGAAEEALRADVVENLRGGAALLSTYQIGIAGPTGSASDPAAWYGAVARYSGADSADAAAAFADEVFATIRTGAARVTDDGQRVTLAARDIQPDRSWLDRLGLRKLARPDGLECPVDISCEWIPAPYEAWIDSNGNPDYGNHDKGNRPRQQKIEYIGMHDTEGYFQPSVNVGLEAKDVGWHAGNWHVNAKAIGLEHEGFAAQGTWYTEAMYRTSAKLVRHLALRLGIPLDRNHIIGHDNVPGTVPSTVRGMHWDPGPYWNWSHYFDLLKAPFRTTGWPGSGLVTIDPDFATNKPAFVGCSGGAAVPCPPRGSSAVVLHTAPDPAAPLVKDIGLRPGGEDATMHISDHGARASAGQTYAVADRQGDWTAIWYLGQKAWFHNPRSAPSAKWATGLVVTPKPGKETIPVYGRAYPEQAAYPEGVPYQAITPLQYTLAAGQRYAVGNVLPSEYYRAVTFDGSSPGDWTVIRGEKKYVQIQFGHRVMFVDLADVNIRPSFL
jgi:hypothetical protein